MQRLILALLISALPLAAIADAPSPSPGKVVPVRDVIEAAAAAEGEPVHATVEILLQGMGSEHGVVFLNSERDYRDLRNITIELRPDSFADLRQRFGEQFPETLVGQRIRVTGEAYRATIWFYCEGVRTGKYYFQTHLRVTDGRHVQRVF